MLNYLEFKKSFPSIARFLAVLAADSGTTAEEFFNVHSDVNLDWSPDDMNLKLAEEFARLVTEQELFDMVCGEEQESEEVWFSLREELGCVEMREVFDKICDQIF